MPMATRSSVLLSRAAVASLQPRARFRSTARNATQAKLTTRMGGIFEPFLDNSSKDAKAEDQMSPSTILETITTKELLPPDDQLQMLTEQKQFGLTLEKQKKIIDIVLTSIQSQTDVQSDDLWQMTDKNASELSALGNIVLRGSPFGAPVALELYRCAMEKGDDRGAFSYASMVYRGYRGTEKREDEGVKVMSALAQKGHPYAQMNLAAILVRSYPDRVQDAIKLYELAGRAGVDSAYTDLGRMFRLGYGVHQDHSKAIEYFQRGAQAGNAQCNFMLGVYCSSGLGAEDKTPDQEKAFKHFQKAAMKGMPEAQYNVGLRFLKGHGVEANSFNASEFFRMAAVQNFQLAQANLAGMYIEGRGVKKDLVEARQWLEKAAAAGGTIGKDAQKRLDQLENSGTKCAIM